MKLLSKTNLCIMSMELIFILAFVKSINIPVYFGSDWEFVGWSNLFLQHPGNFVAFFCLIGLIWSQCVYWTLRHKLKGSPDTLPVRICNIENKDAEYLSLLFTILTIVSFDFSNIRDIIVYKLPKNTIFLSYGEIPLDNEIVRSYQKISRTVYWLCPQA